MCSYLPICFSKSPRRFLFIYFLSCVFHSNAPFRPQLAASGVGQPASVWKWRNWEVRDHSVGHRDCTGCRWWGSRKPTSARHQCTASLLFMHWLQHCFRSHFSIYFLVWGGMLESKYKVVWNPLMNVNHLHVSSSPAQGRWGPFLHFMWWKQCCYKDDINRMGKISCCKIWKMGAKLNCSTTFQQRSFSRIYICFSVRARHYAV